MPDTRALTADVAPDPSEVVATTSGQHRATGGTPDVSRSESQLTRTTRASVGALATLLTLLGMLVVGVLALATSLVLGLPVAAVVAVHAARRSVRDRRAMRISSEVDIHPKPLCMAQHSGLARVEH